MWKILLAIAVAVVLVVFATTQINDKPNKPEFIEIASLELDGNAEILQTNADGTLLVYTNSKRSSVDVVDLTDPEAPYVIAAVEVPGEPTSVDLSPDGNWAVVTLHKDKAQTGETPPDLRLPGLLALLDLRDPASPALATIIGIANHPDSIAVSQTGDELLAVIAIENEPVYALEGLVVDDDAGGEDISAPGVVQLVRFNPERPGNWNVTTLEFSATELNNALMLNTDDPQPEFVTLSPGRHMAAVSLQENNGIVLIDLSSAEIAGAFSLGQVVERAADLVSDGEVKLSQNYPTDVQASTLAGSRFPDAIAFTPDGQYLLSADEGEADLTGGRGFSIWSLNGELIWDDGGEVEQRAAQANLYPDERSENKGVEIEGITAGRFGSRDFAFAVSERGSFLIIYDISNPAAPQFVQLLPTGTGPESVVAVPERNLVVVSAEESGVLTLFRYEAGDLEAAENPAAESPPEPEPEQEPEPEPL